MIMSRFATLVMVLSLGVAACANNRAFARGSTASMQSSSPAISPWPWSLPNDPGQEARLYSPGAGDAK
jgi:hypothetical protein